MALRFLASLSSIKPALRSASNAHLLSGHGIESESGGYLSNADASTHDHNEIDDDQDDKDHKPDKIIASHDKIPKGSDDLACRRGALIAVEKDKTGNDQSSYSRLI